MSTLHSLLAALAFAGACDRGAPAITGPTPVAVGGGPPVATSRALDDVVGARCAREARCSNIGAGRHYVDRAACAAAVRQDYADTFGAARCGAGVDPSELRECLAEVQNRDCNNPLDFIEQATACRAEELCPSRRAPR